MQKRYFCNLCKVTFNKPSLFILDRQNHISNGDILKEEIDKKDGRPEAVTA